MAPVTYYLLIDGMRGNATDPAHAGWFALENFDLKILRDIVQSGSSLMGAASPTLDPVILNLASDPGLTALFSALLSTSPIRSMRIEGVSAAGQPVYRLDLGTAFVTQLNDQGDGGFQLGVTAEDVAVGVIQPNGSFSTSVFDFNNNVAQGNFPVPVVGNGPMTVTASSFFLELAGITDETGLVSQSGWSVIDAPFLGFDRDVAFSKLGAPTFATLQADPLELTLHSRALLPALLAAQTAGTVLAGATIKGLMPNGAQGYNLDLANVRITSVLDYGEDIRVTLSFDRIDLQTWRPDGAGGLLANTPVGANLVTHLPDGAVPSVSPGGAGIAATEATTWFLVVDGMNGGATAAGHVGWFALEGFNLESGNTPDQNLVRLDLAGLTGESALMAAIASGARMAGARLEGLSSSGGWNSVTNSPVVAPIAPCPWLRPGRVARPRPITCATRPSWAKAPMPGTWAGCGFLLRCQHPDLDVQCGQRCGQTQFRHRDGSVVLAGGPDAADAAGQQRSGWDADRRSGQRRRRRPPALAVGAGGGSRERGQGRRWRRAGVAGVHPL